MNALRKLQKIMVKKELSIRAIPKTVRHIEEMRHCSEHPNGHKEFLPGFNREMWVYETTPEHGGKFVVESKCGTNSMVWFRGKKFYNSLEEILKENSNMDISQQEQEVIDTLSNWSETEKDTAYRHLWLPHVIKDIASHMEDYLDEDQYLTEDEISQAAYKYVYEGRYDCNLSYWQNIESLIDEELKNH